MVTQNSSQIEKRHKAKKALTAFYKRINLAFLVITIVMPVVLLIQYLEIEKAWESDLSHYSQNNQLLFQLQTHIGYGGYIHDFKNVVLRKDIEKYNRLSSHQIDIENTLKQLQAVEQESKSLAYIKEIKATFQTYFDRHPQLFSYLNSKMEISDVDRLIKVDDQPAVAALQYLIEMNRVGFQKSAEKHSNQLDVLGVLIVFTFTLLALLMMTLRILQNKNSSLYEDIVELNQKVISLEDFYANAFDSMSDCVLITDNKGVIEHFNNKTIEFFGYNRVELIGQNVTFLMPEGVHKKNHDDYMASTNYKRKILNRGRTLEAKTKSGKLVTVEITISPFVINGEQKFIGVIHDASERIALMNQLAKAVEKHKADAITDFLTGVYNRKGFFQYAQSMLSKAKREAASISILMIDLDHFKEVNDQYGHDAGDRILVEVAKIMQYSCRAEDVLARWGGEEFIMLLDNKTLTETLELAERLRQNIENTEFIYSAYKIKQTISIGLVNIVAEQETSLEDIVTEADEAVYVAKSSGRNCVKTFQQSS